MTLAELMREAIDQATLAEIEQAAVYQALLKYANVTLASMRLGITCPTVRSHMRNMGITLEQLKAQKRQQGAIRFK